MPRDKRNYAINWTDGMKLNKDHFVGHENWILQSLRDQLFMQLTDFNYGLLENDGNTGSSLELLINIDQNNQINVKLTDCHAVTKGGRRIDITAENIQTYQYPLEMLNFDFNTTEATNEMYDVILAVFPENRIPIGQPDEQEIPFRHPYIQPEYRLHAVPTKQVNTSQMWNNHITIGRFQIVAREVQFYTDYIPPCTRIGAYPALQEQYHQFGNTIEKISGFLAEYLRKNRDNQNKLENNVSYLLEKLVFYLTVNLSHYRIILRTQAPIFMIEFFMRFAQLFKSALGWLSEYEREAILNYFSNWISTRDLDNAAFELMNLQYDHQDIYASVQKVANYLNLVHDLFEKMVFSGKAVTPVKESKPQPKHGPIIIKDGKRIN